MASQTTSSHSSTFPKTISRLTMVIATSAIVVQIYLEWKSLWLISPGTSFRSMGLGLWTIFVALIAFLVNGLFALQCLAQKAWRCALIATISCIIGGPGSFLIGIEVGHWIAQSHQLTSEP